MSKLNTRVEKLEAKKPAQPIVVIWEDMDKPGVFYRHSDRIGAPLSEDDIELLNLNNVLIKVCYRDKDAWRGKYE